MTNENFISYFAYGSNMATRRLLNRLPEARCIGIGRLDGHRLSFRKSDLGLSGKCDIEHSANPAHQVIGVVYEMTIEEKVILDRIEDLGIGYDEKTVDIQTSPGIIRSALTYYAIDIDTTVDPYHWYKEHVLRGAMEHGFPNHYIDAINAFISIDDPDNHRSEIELAIYD